MYRPTKLVATIATLVAVAVVGIPTLSSDVDASGDCSLVRTYGFTTVSNDAAWASIVGHMGLFDSDDGQHEYTLALNDRHEQYLRESIAGGCTPEVAYQTRAMTSVLNLGTSWYSGTATLSAGESGSVSESGSHPLPDCDRLVCSQNSYYATQIGEVTAGTSITLSGASSATATVFAPGTANQAHASWTVRHPVLRIPIP